MNSIQSNALEPTRSELKGLTTGQKLGRLIPVYGLVILTVGLILLFSILLPHTFPTLLNLRSIISDKAIILLLSLGVMIPMSAGRIDLTVGYGIVLWHILAISLQTMYGFPWPVAVLTVLSGMALDGRLSQAVLWQRWGLFIGPALAGVWLGHRLAHRVPVLRLRQMICALLVVSGSVLATKALV